MDFLTPFLTQTIIPVFGTIFTALFSWGAAETVKYVRTKTKNEAVNDAISHVVHTVETTVREVEQSVRPKLIEAVEEGKLTDAKARQIKNIAIGKINAQVPSAIKAVAEKGVNSLSDFISAQVEKAVHDMKAQK